MPTYTTPVYTEQQIYNYLNSSSWDDADDYSVITFGEEDEDHISDYFPKEARRLYNKLYDRLSLDQEDEYYENDYDYDFNELKHLISKETAKLYISGDEPEIVKWFNEAGIPI